MRHIQRPTAHEFTTLTPLVAADRATTRRLPLLLEASLLRVAVPQKDVTAIQAHKVDVFEWESRVRSKGLSAFTGGAPDCHESGRDAA